MPERREPIDVAGLGMDAFVADPDGAGPYPGIVVIMHAPGLDAFTEEMARRLAGEGYAAIAPQIYHRQDLASDETGLERMARLLDDEVIADIGACVEYLQGRSDVTDDLGIVGFCMGGRITFLAATANPAFRAAVPFYGGSVDVAWGDGPTVIDRLGGIACPVLAFFGGKDGNPSPEMMHRLDAELTRLGQGARLPRLRRRGPRLHELQQPRPLLPDRGGGVVGADAGLPAGAPWGDVVGADGAT